MDFRPLFCPDVYARKRRSVVRTNYAGSEQEIVNHEYCEKRRSFLRVGQV